MRKKNQDSFEKRRRDTEKKLRAEDKRKKKLRKKAETVSATSDIDPPTDSDT